MERQIYTPAGIRVNTIVLTFTLISGLVVFLRMFTRIALIRTAGFEDACIVLAMASSIALAVLTSEQVMHGLGKHSSQLTTNELDLVLKTFRANLWIYNLALSIVKTSILVQYLRIFSVPRFRKACFAVLGAVVASGAWAVFSSNFICNSIAFWDNPIPDGHCMKQSVVLFTNAGIDITLDVVILLMPTRVIRTLQLPKGQKKGLYAMFALGASVALVSVIRLPSLDDIATSTDIPFDNTLHATLSAVEVNIGIFCACLPGMRPLLVLMMPKYFSANTRHTNITMTDIERPKHMHTPSTSTGTISGRTNSPRAHIPRRHTPLEVPILPRPTLSRTPSGRFDVVHSRSNSYSHIPRQPSSLAHLRSASNTSVSSTAAQIKSAARFQGRIDPLRMSPITPFSPPLPPSRLQDRTIIPMGSGSYTRRQAGTISPSTSSQTSRTPDATKPLPITPFPVGPGE